MSNPLDEAVTLFNAGERDRKTFFLLLGTGEAPHENMGFCAQQACEKFIKTVLVVHGVFFSRTHDLEWLAELAQEHGLTVPVAVAALRLLNPYAVSLRYDGSCEVWLAPETAGEMVETLHDWARAQVFPASGS